MRLYIIYNHYACYRPCVVIQFWTVLCKHTQKKLHASYFSLNAGLLDCPTGSFLDAVNVDIEDKVEAALGVNDSKIRNFNLVQADPPTTHYCIVYVLVNNFWLLHCPPNIRTLHICPPRAKSWNKPCLRG